jgi:hypothetical protein
MAIGEKTPANETSREELLQRDVYILFNENRELKKRIKKIGEEFESLKQYSLEQTKRIAQLKLELESWNETDEVEVDSFEEISFYIESQRKAMGLSYNKLGKLFGMTGGTVENYAKCRGSYKNAARFAEMIREHRRNNAKRT